MRFAPINAVLLACVLAGCESSGVESGTTTPTPSIPVPTALCVSSDCGEKVVLLDFPSAENLTFSPDGRLFVSGGLGVFEVTRDAAGAFHATDIAPGCGGGLGLATHRGQLYAICSGQRLFAGALTTTPQLGEVFQLSGMCISNGMAVGADGNLYVVDEPLNFCVPDPKVVRLTLDPADPLRVLSQETWVQGSPLGQLHLGLDNVLRFPNGLQARGNRFFGTDGGSLYSVDLLPDGRAGPVTPIHFEVAIRDDLGIAGDDLLVTDFATGRIQLISQAGVALQATERGLFSSPSSIRLGQPPMFAPGDILVTETGVLTDNRLPLDRLSLFRRKAP